MLASELYKIFKKAGSAGGHVNDIICCLSPSEIAALKSAYLEGMFNDVVARLVIYSILIRCI